MAKPIWYTDHNGQTQYGYPHMSTAVSGDPRIVRPLIVIGFVVFFILPYLFF